MTTIDTITDAQIEALMTEAGEAGDMAQVAICQAALALTLDTVTIEEMAAARAECARVIADAEGQ